MKSTLILWCLHGNPGRFEDFSRIQQILRPHGVVLKELETNLTNPAKILEPVGPREGVLAYSWGSYALLKSIEARGQKFENPIFLIAPFLRATKPLSGFAKILTHTPLISNLLIQLSWKKWSLDFQNRMFRESELALGKEYLDWIQSSAVWEQTVSRKVFQDSHPLSPKVSSFVKGHLQTLMGSLDKIMDPQEAINNLKFLNLNPELTSLETAGHALPWTHPQEISNWILNNGGIKK